MKTKWISILWTILLLGVTILPLQAAEGDITLGGITLLRIRVPAGGMTIQQRADTITERLNELLGAGDIKADAIKTAIVNNEIALTVDNKTIITIDRETAKLNGTTPAKLGQIWVENIRSILPQVKAKEQ